MSATPPPRPPHTLPPPSPADLVEGRAAWAELGAVEVDALVERGERLGAAAGDDAQRLAADLVAGGAAARLALERRLSAGVADELVEWAASRGGQDVEGERVSLFLRTLLELAVSAVQPEVRATAALTALVAFGPARGARAEVAGGGRITVGEPVDDDDAITLATADAGLDVTPVAGAEDRCRAFAEEAIRLLRPREASRPSAGAAELSRLEAAERRLRRLALDLHDGPAQDAAALASDATLLEADLAGAASAETLAQARALAGEIRHRLLALGRDIRDLAEVLEPRAILGVPLRDVLEREAETFARRVGVTPSLQVDEELGAMTASQQIALARVAREALTNVGEHAAASSVSIVVTASAAGVSLVVTDDGRGFDVAAVREQRSGSGLGIDGMHERVRLLGGRLELDSRPGGPTRVAALVPRWRPST
jgi:signal transduction histidine kinase